MKRAIIWVAVSTQSQAAPEKVSLGEQERLLREYCAQHDCRIIDTLSVPGHSRSESDVIAALEELAAQGCFAYQKLREHWKKRTFDILVAFDNSRFARSQSLHAYVVENTIRAGATIHMIQGGDIDEDNLEMGIALGGISATAGLRRLKKLGDAGMQARMDRGLSMNNAPSTHRLVYDEVTGKPRRLEVRDELQPLFDDVAKLLLDGVGWLQFPNLMAALGHLNPRTGKPYPSSFFWKLFHNPYTWGATARRFLNRYGQWAFDEDAPLPVGVLINRHPSPPVPPVWTGHQAGLIQAELRRRALIRGRATSHKTYRFTGILICAGCGRTMAITFARRRSGRVVLYWQCATYKLGKKAVVKTCDQNRVIRDDVAQQQIADTFQRMRDLGLYDIAKLVNKEGRDDTQVEIARLRKQIAAHSKKVDVMISRQAVADERVQDNYARQIAAASEQLSALDQRLQALLVQVESSPSAQKDRQMAAQEIIDNMDQFWTLENRVINQALHRALGKIRFVVREGKVVDVR